MIRVQWMRAHLEDYYAHLGDYNGAKECRNKAIEILKAVTEDF